MITYSVCSSSDTSEVEEVKATIVLLRGELLYDIKNMGYVEGDVARVDDAHARHQVQDVGEDGNVDRVTRILDLAFSECEDMLYPYTKRDLECGTQEDDKLEETEEYVLKLTVPSTVSATTITYVERLVHEYMVCRVMVDWLSITNLANPKSVEYWSLKLKDIEEKMGQAMMMRTSRRRRKLSPF